jgi:transcriptional regulator with XRE-family HTH domain
MIWNGLRQKSHRIAAGVSLRNFAKALGIAASHLWNIENKGVQPAVGLAFEIAKLLKKPPKFFLDK